MGSHIISVQCCNLKMFLIACFLIFPIFSISILALFDSSPLIQTQNSIISFGYVASQAKIFLTLYPPFENSTTLTAILFILLFFSRDRNYGVPQGPFTHMHHLLYSCWGFLQLYSGQFSVLQFLPTQTFMVYMKQRLHQLVPKILPYQVIYHTIDRRNTSCLVTSPYIEFNFLYTQ